MTMSSWQYRDILGPTLPWWLGQSQWISSRVAAQWVIILIDRIDWTWIHTKPVSGWRRSITWKWRSLGYWMGCQATVLIEFKRLCRGIAEWFMVSQCLSRSYRNMIYMIYSFNVDHSLVAQWFSCFPFWKHVWSGSFSSAFSVQLAA